MKRHPILALAAAALATLAETVAGAEELATEEKPYLRQDVPTPTRALELTVATGYTQGFGTLEPGIGMPQIAKAGAGVDATVGYRIEPHYSVSIGGQYQELQAERDDDEAVRGFALNLALQYHIAPSARLDPWLELGSGYRMLWLVPAGPERTVFLHGPQLASVRAGVDVRLSPGVAVSPVIGADATMFVFRDDATLTAISRPTVSAFVYAGLQGRFDIGATNAPSL